ncbi:MAG TPA: DndE family protein [Cytophagaceae bacterium]|jgi:DNA sulfur modification protein DndE|nr:DndE family protein [Cytophagaceae bacterium]
MFTGIKTSKANKEIVSDLTKKLGLGAENVIARIAFSCSLAKGKKMDLLQIEDAQGKEYTSKVLFGENIDIYLSAVCVHYNLYKTDKDIGKYIKMHVDDGLKIIKEELSKKDASGTDFLINKIEKGLKTLV